MTAAQITAEEHAEELGKLNDSGTLNLGGAQLNFGTTPNGRSIVLCNTAEGTYGLVDVGNG